MFKQIFVFSLIALAIAGVPKLIENAPSGGKVASIGTPTAQNNQTLPGAATTQAENSTPASYVTGVRSAQIEMDRSGHFTADFRINGQVVEGLVDTGATYVVMNMSTARKVGIRASVGDFRHQVSTANGIARAARVTLSRMEIGPISISDVEAFVMEDKALTSTLIGMSFMSKLASYQVEGHALKLVN